MQDGNSAAARKVDLEKFRLRRFAERLIEIGEVVVHDAPVPLAQISRVVEASPKAALFRSVGPEKFELIAAVAGSRKRIATAFGVDERAIAHEYARRMANPQPVVEVPSRDAPVHQVVVQGGDIDLTKLPFHLQHELDGGPYISSGIDYSVDPATGRTNVGCRRLMLRSRTTMTSNLTDMSDLKRAYLGCLERKQRLPVSFAIGSTPLDFLAAGQKLPVDEFGLVATLRGEPVPMVKSLTNDILVPADAEMIIEGYFDELGYREIDGPYGEFYGFYGALHPDPVFHVTAITHRRDVLHQTVLHAGRYLSRTDSANLGAINAELRMWRVLRAAGIEPSALYALSAVTGRQHTRVALKRGQSGPGAARAAINALFSVPVVKHVFVVDDDIDVFDQEQMEWAMAARFRADRNLVVQGGLPSFYMDPGRDDLGQVAKAGFDMTRPYGGGTETIEDWIAVAPRYDRGTSRANSVRNALESGPKTFMQLMEAMGSTDGRDISIALSELAEQGAIERLKPNGEWALKTT